MTRGIFRRRLHTRYLSPQVAVALLFTPPAADPAVDVLTAYRTPDMTPHHRVRQTPRIIGWGLIELQPPPSTDALVAFRRDEVAVRLRRRWVTQEPALPAQLFAPPVEAPAVRVPATRDTTATLRREAPRPRQSTALAVTLYPPTGPPAAEPAIVAWKRDDRAVRLRRRWPTQETALAAALFPVPAVATPAEPATTAWRRDTTATHYRPDLLRPGALVGYGLIESPTPPATAEPAVVAWRRDDVAVRLRRRWPTQESALPAQLNPGPGPPKTPAEPAAVTWKRDTAATHGARPHMHVSIKDRVIYLAYDSAKAAARFVALSRWRYPDRATIYRRDRWPTQETELARALFAPTPATAAEPGVVAWKRDTLASMRRAPFRRTQQTALAAQLFAAPAAPPVAEPAIVAWRRDDVAVYHIPQRLHPGTHVGFVLLDATPPPVPAEPGVVAWRRDDVAVRLRRRWPTQASALAAQLFPPPAPLVTPAPAADRTATLRRDAHRKPDVTRLPTQLYAFAAAPALVLPQPDRVPVLRRDRVRARQETALAPQLFAFAAPAAQPVLARQSDPATLRRDALRPRQSTALAAQLYAFRPVPLLRTFPDRATILRRDPFRQTQQTGLAAELFPPPLTPAEPAAVAYRRDVTASKRRDPFRVTQQPALPPQLFAFKPPTPPEPAVVSWRRDTKALHYRHPFRRTQFTAMPAALMSQLVLTPIDSKTGPAIFAPLWGRAIFAPLWGKAIKE